MEEEKTVHRKIAELRTACEREIRARRQKADLVADNFRRSLQPFRARAEENLGQQENLVNLKDQLRELEDSLRRTLSVKSCKEMKHKNTVESLSATKERNAELRKIVQDQRARKDGYAALISQQLHALDAVGETSNQDNIERENIEEAILWYNKVLGFRTEGGEGVKFIFNKLDSKNLDKEFSFTIRLEGDTYRLLQCDPILKDTTELVEQLNQTNGLYEFARAMRKKFQAVSSNVLPAGKDIHQDLSTITISSPPPVSVDTMSDSVTRENDHSVQHRKRHISRMNSHNQRSFHQKTPLSAARRSPRFQSES